MKSNEKYIQQQEKKILRWRWKDENSKLKILSAHLANAKEAPSRRIT